MVVKLGRRMVVARSNYSRIKVESIAVTIALTVSLQLKESSNCVGRRLVKTMSVLSGVLWIGSRHRTRFGAAA